MDTQNMPLSEKILGVDPGSPASTRFHCCSEWHLARLKSPTANLIYTFALRISKTSHRFACSAAGVADFLGLHRTTVLRAYHELRDAGFFELLEYGQFDSSIYRVLTHDEWKEKYPGRCTVKEQFPWSGEGDPLGRKLYAASGCRVMFKEFQVNNYRKTGVDEATIVALFTEWREGLGKYRQPRNVPFRFLQHLRSVADGPSKHLQ